jgi:DNA-directed RNA polymerase subunit E'/Rpb7
MFILYKIQDEVYLEAEHYTHNFGRTLKDAVFKKYLYKITQTGLCVKIKSIEVVDNVLLRKEAELLVKVLLEIIVIKLIPNEYFEGEVTEFDEKEGLVVNFLGVLEGRIQPNNLHEGSLFNGTNWIFPIDEDKAFTWKIGEKVRFKVESTGKSKARFRLEPSGETNVIDDISKSKLRRIGPSFMVVVKIICIHIFKVL